MTQPKDKSLELDSEDIDTVLLSSKSKDDSRKLSWYYAPPFLLFWVVLFFATVIPIFRNLPDSINIADELSKPGEFVAERADRILYLYDQIGIKTVGSYGNEVLTVQLLLEQIENVRAEMRNDLYEMEVDLQQPSGAYAHWKMVNMYQGIQNIVVKLSTRSSSSDNYLLVNSHFDSKPSSPGTGDDGVMVVVMLEVLRQMVISETVFEHPIIFLFNGAEENPLQASHGFITQHKWASNCKAVVNLEVSGSGGREILFQTGPNHPWLVNYYSKTAKHPFSTTMGEEIFQAGLIPSDTDFRIFRDFGNIPGLDFAQISNGYVYHTIFDNYKNIPRASLQNTGENILPLVRALANASELYHIEESSEGHAVFFDFLGLFLIHYTQSTGVALNISIAVLSLILVAISLWRMARLSNCSLGQITIWFLILFVLHFLGTLLCFGLPALMAVMYDAGNRAMCYFTNLWLMIGLYILPAIVGLTLPTTLYYSFKKNDKISHSYYLQMSLHAHCVFLALLDIVLTAIRLRTPYLCLISLTFYCIALLINLITRLQERGYYWALVIEIAQFLPFIYFSYIIYAFLTVLIPMMARNGSSINPDLYISVLCALGVFLAIGFVAPLINMFRWPKLIQGALGIIIFIFCMISLSNIGFPYRPLTSVMRIHFLHVRRIFYEFDGSISLSDSGYYFDFQDRNLYHPLEDTSIDLTGLININEDCDKYTMCGVPCFNHRWCKALETAHWLPRSEPVELPGVATLQLLNKTIILENSTVHYEFKMSGPSHMSLFIQPLEGASVLDWSFIRTTLDDSEKYSAPYHIFFSYGNDNSPLVFYIDIKNSDGEFDGPLLEVGFSAHFVSSDYERDSIGQQFINDFPNFAHVMEWPTLYERFIF